MLSNSVYPQIMWPTRLDRNICTLSDNFLMKLTSSYIDMTVGTVLHEFLTISRVSLVIQIKICAEYRDMLPRPRLVCQEPGLRPIGRSPGVPDKSSRLFYRIHFPKKFFIPLWVWLGTLQACQHAQCPLPLSIVIRMRLVIRQSKLLACLAEMQVAHQNILWHLSHSLVKMTDKMDEICINREFSAQEPSEWRDFSIPVCNFTIFQPRI